MTEDKQVELVENPKILGAVDLPKIDLKPYNGVKSKIVKVEFEKHKEYGTYVKLTSAVLDTIEKKEIIASRVLGLIEVKNKETGEIDGLGWGSESKTFAFLKKCDAETLEDLKGKEIVVLYDITKTGKEVLTF